ncbi:protein-L-isoaspartate O-methyltransferase [Mycena rebaudengoi]|nr:protein-L-isoaspartate O-methyltransferase [Mycena rebaudengoi]
MAWRCAALRRQINRELVENIVKSKIMKSPEAQVARIAHAMQAVDRAHYVPEKSAAYDDRPQSIDHGATISVPHMHAYAVEYLLPFLHPGTKVLDIGSGSGFLCAVLYHFVYGASLLVTPEPEARRMHALQGYPSEGPYDAIHIGAAAPTIPEPLIAQPARPGRMFIPVGTHSQCIMQVDKDKDGSVTKKEVMAVSINHLLVLDPSTDD